MPPILIRPDNVSRIALSSPVGPIVNTTALQNITGLGVALGASPNEIQLVKFWLLIDAANPTMDAKFGFAVPAGATMRWGFLSDAAPGTQLGLTPPTTNANSPAGLANEAGTIVVGTFAGVSAVAFVAWIFGGGTPGIAQIQFSQNTADPGNLSMARGSAMEAIKLAAA